MRAAARRATRHSRPLTRADQQCTSSSSLGYSRPARAAPRPRRRTTIRTTIAPPIIWWRSPTTRSSSASRYPTSAAPLRGCSRTSKRPAAPSRQVLQEAGQGRGRGRGQRSGRRRRRVRGRQRLGEAPGEEGQDPRLRLGRALPEEALQEEEQGRHEGVEGVRVRLRVSPLLSYSSPPIRKSPQRQDHLPLRSTLPL